jgi:hypothetical protein
MPTQDSARDASETSRLLAWALYDLRLLLSPHVGGASDATPEVRAAAELAYAVHNLALAAIQGSPIREAQFSEALARAERASGEPFLSRYQGTMQGGG